MEKEEFIERCMSSMQETMAVAEGKFRSLVMSGSVDLESANMADVKVAVKAFLLSEAEQRNPFDCSYKKGFNRRVNVCRSYL